MRRFIPFTIAAILVTASALPIAAHCQIPCGIYNDTLRVEMMYEHITTIEKSMRLISELSGKTAAADVNQMVRWVNNKEDHANQLSEIATEYFLKQRIKAPATDDAAANATYDKQLRALHGILVNSMKAKQSVDPEIVTTLRSLMDELTRLYFSEEDQKHLTAHDH